MSCAKCGTSHAPDGPCPPPDGFAPSPDAAFDAILAGLDALGAAPPAWRTEPPPPPPAAGDAFSDGAGDLADDDARDELDAVAAAAPTPGWRPGQGSGRAQPAARTARPAARPSAPSRSTKPRSARGRITLLLLTSVSVGAAVFALRASESSSACAPPNCEPLDHAFVTGLPFGPGTDIARLRAALPELGEVEDLGASSGDAFLGLYGPQPARRRVKGPVSIVGVELECGFEFVPGHGLHTLGCTTSGNGYESRGALDAAAHDLRDALSARFGEPVAGEGSSLEGLAVLHDTWTWGAPPDDLVLHSLWLDLGSDASARGGVGIVQRSHAPPPQTPALAEEPP